MIRRRPASKERLHLIITIFYLVQTLTKADMASSILKGLVTNNSIDLWHRSCRKQKSESGNLLHSLFASLLCFALSNQIQSKICYREHFNRCKIHRMEQICLDLGIFEEFATAVLHTVFNSTNVCHVITFFESAIETNGA